MNKRYMDFVPQKATNGVKVVLPEKGARGGRAAGVSRGSATAAKAGAAGARPANGAVAAKSGMGTEKTAETQPKFVKTSLEKRPLSSGVRRGGGVAGVVSSGAAGAGTSDSAAAAKAKKLTTRRLGLKSLAGKREKASAEEAGAASVPAADGAKTMKIPVTPFVNTEKVVKRPLSKNVYTKKPVVVASEEPSRPVTIIEQPEKDSRVGLVVTIIITIILGAAAGTVAFLLLPK